MQFIQSSINRYSFPHNLNTAQNDLPKNALAIKGLAFFPDAWFYALTCMTSFNFNALLWDYGGSIASFPYGLEVCQSPTMALFIPLNLSFHLNTHISKQLLLIVEQPTIIDMKKSKMQLSKAKP